MSATEALQEALRCVHRIANLMAIIQRLESGIAASGGTGVCSASRDPSWSMADKVERITDCREKIAELEDTVSSVASAIWMIDTGDTTRDWQISTVLTRLYLEDSRVGEIAYELQTTADGVRNLKRAGIRWLDNHFSL